MKRIKDLDAWEGFAGARAFPVPAGQLLATVVTMGASVFYESASGGRILLASGRGFMQIDVQLPEDGEVGVIGDKVDSETALYINGWGPVARDAGWSDAESFTQLDLKSRDDVSAEVRAMLEKQERNALRREAMLRGEIEKLRGAR